MFQISVLTATHPSFPPPFVLSPTLSLSHNLTYICEGGLKVEWGHVSCKPLLCISLVAWAQTDVPSLPQLHIHCLCCSPSFPRSVPSSERRGKKISYLTLHMRWGLVPVLLRGLMLGTISTPSCECPIEGPV